MSTRVLLMFLVSMLLLTASAQAVVVHNTPTAVPYFAGLENDTDYVTKAIDGSNSTFTVLLTDSLGGTSDPTHVPDTATGTTGHLIFDMGSVLSNITDMTMFPRSHSSLQLGVKNFDLFYFADGVASDSDDIEGDPNIVLLGNYTSAGPLSGGFETFALPSSLNTQYIGMRVNSAYPQDTPYNGTTYYNFQIAEVYFDTDESLQPGPNSPSGVVLVSGETDSNPLTNILDGNLGTQVVVKDDTLTGTSTTTDPAYGSAPVTGHMVFDMGEEAPISGAILTSRNHSLQLGPKDVDFFYYADGDPLNNAVADDIEGDDDIILITSDTFAGVNLNATDQIDWSPVSTRYIGMRVNNAYAEGPTYYNFQIAEMEFIVAAVPEPSMIALLLIGAAALVGFRVRR